MKSPAPLRWQGKWFVALLRGESKSRKTWIWVINGAVELGEVRWYAPWRRYAYFPNSDTVYEPDCLRDLANFCEERTQAHEGRVKP